jgi:bifunctional non-homologous end joining protein LigD
MKAKFIDVMLLLRTDRLPGGQEWLYEIKLDGYRALAIKTSGKLQLRSRNDNDFTQRYPSIAAGLQKMPDETVIDGEIVALDAEGHPSFNMLQNYGSSKAPLIYYIFDVLVLCWPECHGRNARFQKGAARKENTAGSFRTHPLFT